MIELDVGRLVDGKLLQLSGFEVTRANHGKRGLELFREVHVDLCVLDVMMPVMDGFTLAENLRKANPDIPIIFLTAKNQKEDKLRGLKLGADDYITKPFEADELVLRINNILRRTTGRKEDNNNIGTLELKMDELKLISQINEYPLTLREAELLSYLAKHKNEVVSRDQLLSELWGKTDYFMGRSMDVFISRIRKYLQDDPDLELETIRGIGYILRLPVNK